MSSVFSANHSSLLVDGEPIEGIQSLAFRVVTECENIRAIGSNERAAVVFGLRTVAGEVAVRSTATLLDDKLTARASFNMVATMKKGSADDSPRRSYSFDDCYVDSKDFVMGASGSGQTTYAFTATRVREE